MLKVKRDDFYELNNNDDFNLDNVNDLFKQISQNHSDDEKKEEEDEEDGGEEDEV